MTELVRPFQEGKRMGEEPLPGIRQWRQPAGPAPLAIQLGPELRLERDQPVAEPLFRDPQAGCGGPDLAMASELDERRDLVGAEMRGELRRTRRALCIVNSEL